MYIHIPHIAESPIAASCSFTACFNLNSDRSHKTGKKEWVVHLSTDSFYQKPSVSLWHFCWASCPPCYISPGQRTIELRALPCLATYSQAEFSFSLWLFYAIVLIKSSWASTRPWELHVLLLWPCFQCETGPQGGQEWEIWSYRACLKQGTRLQSADPDGGEVTIWDLPAWGWHAHGPWPGGTCSGLGRRPWCSPEGLLAWRMGRSTPSLGAHDQEHTSKAYFEVLLYYNTTTSHPRDQDQCRTTQNTLSSYLLSSGSAGICHLVCIEVAVGHIQIVSQRPPLPACCASTLSKMQKSSTDPAISSFKE